MYISTKSGHNSFDAITLRITSGYPSNEEYWLVKFKSGYVPANGAMSSFSDHLIAQTEVMPFGNDMMLVKYEAASSDKTIVKPIREYLVRHLMLMLESLFLLNAMSTATAEVVAAMVMPKPSHIVFGVPGR